MAGTENRGLTTREVVLAYCTYWTQAAYLDCWPRPREVDPDATTEEKKNASLVAARELMAMLRHEVPGQDDTASTPKPMEEPADLQIIGDLVPDAFASRRATLLPAGQMSLHEMGDYHRDLV